MYGFVSSIGESAVANIMSDIDALKAEAKTAGLSDSLNKSFQETLALRATIADFREKNQAEAEQMRAKMEALGETLSQKMSENVKEVMNALMPVVMAAQTKVHERLQNLKEMVHLYAAELMEPLKAMHEQAQSISQDEIIVQKIHTLAQETKSKFLDIVAHVSASVNKS